MVKTSTPANVPIIDGADFGEKERHVKIEIIKKYMLAALLN